MVSRNYRRKLPHKTVALVAGYQGWLKGQEEARKMAVAATED